MAMNRRRELEAARWAERLADGPDAGTFPDFVRWRDRPGNADAHRRAADARLLVAVAADGPELEDLRRQTRSRIGPASRDPRSRHRAAAAVAVALLATPVAVWLTRAPSTKGAPAAVTASVLHATARGERRTIRLSDGSRVTLDTASRVRVAYTRSDRALRMEAGQALFEVAPDAARPFTVSAGGRAVTARGTVFDIRLDPGRLQVALIEGRVEVGARGSPPVAMRPDDLLTARGREVTVRRDPAAVAAITDWREGLLVFQDVPLIDAVAEVNRYASRPLVLGDGKVGRLRISGSFRPERLPAFLEALRMGFPVELARRGDGAVVLTARD